MSCGCNIYIVFVEINIRSYYMFLFLISLSEGDLPVVMLMIFWSAMQHYFCRLATWNWFLICKKCHGSPERLETSSPYSSIS